MRGGSKGSGRMTSARLSGGRVKLGNMKGEGTKSGNGGDVRDKDMMIGGWWWWERMQSGWGRRKRMYQRLPSRVFAPRFFV